MDGLKQRIIGALVLVSLAVIFVPMVFDEPHSERTSTSINIPEEPPFPEVDTSDTDIAPPPSYQQNKPANAGSNNQAFQIRESDTPKPTENASVPAASSQDKSAASQPTGRQSVASQPAEPENTKAPEETEETNAEFTRSLEGAWVVQLGSFGSGDNARRLRDKVRDKGYNSHLQEVVRGDNTLTRVFSGPFAEKSKAEEAKRALDETFKLNSLVTSGDK